MSGRTGYIMKHKFHITGILKPDKALGFRLFPQVKTAYAEYIQVPIIINIYRSGIISSYKCGDPMKFKIQISFVFKPLDPVPGLAPGRYVVKCITVCI